MTGWTKKPRSRFAHPLFKNQKFCRGYAWDWLCDHAAYKPVEIEVKGRIVNLERGQLCYSIRYLAEAWNWDKAAVDRFLRRLKTETMIETHTETGQTIITICNYETFNKPERNTETDAETATETGARQERDRSETNKKKDKKDKKYPPLPPSGGQGDLLGDGKPETPLSVLAQVISEERAKAFIEHRKKLRKPMTVHAARLAISELRKMPDPAASVDQSIMNGWAGVFPVKAGNQGQRPQSSILAQIRREEERAAGGER